jgi:hypothetical protein
MEGGQDYRIGNARMEGGHEMSYYFSKIVDNAFDAAVEKITVDLKEEGFGILTERVSIHAVKNPRLKKLAAEIGNKLRTIIDRA